MERIEKNNSRCQGETSAGGTPTMTCAPAPQQKFRLQEGNYGVNRKN
jgi:hypothetical protein